MRGGVRLIGLEKMTDERSSNFSAGNTATPGGDSPGAQASAGGGRGGAAADEAAFREWARDHPDEVYWAPTGAYSHEGQNEETMEAVVPEWDGDHWVLPDLGGAYYYKGPTQLRIINGKARRTMRSRDMDAAAAFRGRHSAYGEYSRVFSRVDAEARAEGASPKRAAQIANAAALRAARSVGATGVGFNAAPRRFPGKVSAKQFCRDAVSDGAAHWCHTMCDPWGSEAAGGCRVPYGLPVPSATFTAVASVSGAVQLGGTNPNIGFARFAPFRMVFNDATSFSNDQPIVATTSATDVASLQSLSAGTTGAVKAYSNSPFSRSQFLASTGNQVRLVGAGIRVRFTNQQRYLGGEVAVVTDRSHTTLTLTTLGEAKSKMKPPIRVYSPSRSYVQSSWRPVSIHELEFVSAEQIESDPTPYLDDYYVGVYITGNGETTDENLAFVVDVIVHVEFVGPITATYPVVRPFLDPVGVAAVLDCVEQEHGEQLPANSTKYLRDKATELITEAGMGALEGATGAARAMLRNGVQAGLSAAAGAVAARWGHRARNQHMAQRFHQQRIGHHGAHQLRLEL